MKTIHVNHSLSNNLKKITPISPTHPPADGHMIPLLWSFRACATLAVGKVCKINANAIEKFVPEKKGEMQQRFPGGAETCSNSWSGNHSL